MAHIRFISGKEYDAYIKKLERKEALQKIGDKIFWLCVAAFALSVVSGVGYLFFKAAVFVVQNSAVFN